MHLVTDKLILREIVENDFSAIHEYASDMDTVQYMLFGPNEENDTKRFISDCKDAAVQNPRNRYDFGIHLKDGAFIGAGAIFIDSDQKQATIGWIINKKYWGNGYCTEFAAELIRFGFVELALHRIYATCDTENIGSYKVMEKNGMRREGFFLKSRLIHGEWRDEYLYAILEEEYCKQEAQDVQESRH